MSRRSQPPGRPAHPPAPFSEVGADAAAYTPPGGEISLPAAREAGQPPGAAQQAAEAASGSSTTTAVCRCGAPEHPERQGRCAAGHVVRGNGLALVAGEASAAFWAEHAAMRHGIARSVMSDAGHSAADAPQALQLAADSIAQAALVQQSAFQRMVESGGPLSSSGRPRRAFVVWVQASDRLERYLRLVGLRRVPKPASSFADAVRKANGGER